MLASPLRASAVKLKGELGAPLGAGSASIARCAKAPGQLGSWQDRNLQMTIPHAIAKLHDTGIIGNFKRLDPHCAEAAASSQYTGRFPFVDTDLYKTLEGVAYEVARLSEHSATCRACDQSDAHQKKKALLAFVEEAVHAILRAQQPDGYVGTYLSGPDAPHPQWSKPAVDHELYNLGHLIQAAIAVNRQLSDDRLLRCAERFADLVNDKFGSTSGSSFTDGHPGVEMALVELARETGRREFVDLAAVLIERRGAGTSLEVPSGLSIFRIACLSPKSNQQAGTLCASAISRRVLLTSRLNRRTPRNCNGYTVSGMRWLRKSRTSQVEWARGMQARILGTRTSFHLSVHTPKRAQQSP